MIEVRKIKVRYLGDSTFREVSLEEAQRILDKNDNDAVGGMVINLKTGETVTTISPEVDEILVIDQMLGGG